MAETDADGRRRGVARRKCGSYLLIMMGGPSFLDCDTE